MFKKRFTGIAALLLAVVLLVSCSGVTDLPGETSGVTNDNNGASQTTVTSDSGVSQTTTESVAATSDTTPQNSTSNTESQTSPEITLTYKNNLYGFEAAAPYAFVVDVRKGEVIYSKGDTSAKVYPASITKLVSAIVALEHCDKKTELTVGDERDLVAFDSSIAGLKKGDTLTLDDLIYCLLLPSGGDAAYTMAAGVGRIIKNDNNLGAREAVDAFVAEMNSFAASIGMKNTVFTCPDGYHDNGHYTTLDDLAKLGVYCVREATLVEYTSCANKTVKTKAGRSLSLKNTNALVNDTTNYYRDYVDGLKTGTTDEGGYCLLSSGSMKNIKYLVGIFGASSTVVRFDDTIRAFDALSVR